MPVGVHHDLATGVRGMHTSDIEGKIRYYGRICCPRTPVKARILPFADLGESILFLESFAVTKCPPVSQRRILGKY